MSDPILEGVPEELQLHLIELYFTWANPWLPVVNEVLFWESLYSGNRYCSSLLLICILGTGARFTDRLEVRSDPADPFTAGKIFLERAEALLQYDMKSPKITTIQSLVIMAILYCVCIQFFCFYSSVETKCSTGIWLRCSLLASRRHGQ